MYNRPITALAALLLALAPQQAAADSPPLADVHTHYKWSQAEVTTPQQAVDALLANDVALAVVIGTPAEYALRLQALAPDIVVPVWSPYRTPGDWSGWAFDTAVAKRAEAALASGRYRGIGELHLIGGFAPRVDTPVIRALAGLAERFDVPLLLHTEISRAQYMLDLCRAYPRTRILWAHAGAILEPQTVGDTLRRCPNVWIELAARDPWRFINNPITDAAGELLPEWRALLLAYSERVMVGSDPVWPVDKLDSWEQADTGWQEYPRFVRFHRRWLETLPAAVAERIRLTNARRFFRVAP